VTLSSPPGRFRDLASCLRSCLSVSINRIIDRTKGIRPSSYFEKVGIVAHAMFGDAFDNTLSDFLAPKVGEPSLLASILRA